MLVDTQDSVMVSDGETLQPQTYPKKLHNNNDLHIVNLAQPRKPQKT